jgi:uncharacterized protein
VRIDVAQLLIKPVGATQSYQIDSAYEGSEINGDLVLTRTGQGILVSGHFETTIDGQCCRCLMPATNSVQFTFNEDYIPVTSVPSINSPESDIPDEKFYIDKNKIIDLTEVFRQYISLAEPMKLLCRPDCPGFCPICGQNLNEQQCSCLTKQIDTRWSKLVPYTKEDKT